jgi:filamentous hemagglutinin family protein
LRACTAAVVAVALSHGSAAAQIATDNSFGPAQSLSGPAFSIGSALGTLSGNNLFHSFSTFNLATGESATFTGPSSLANIVARVTGGSGSSIDGTIATLTGGSPNLFLVNPAGVIFGPNASLNVEGSFHVSTADYLKFADGAKFMSNLGNGSSFSTAEPAAFGFLTANPAAVTIYDSYSILDPFVPGLSVGPGSTINIVGGTVQTVGGVLTAPRAIAITAVASPGEVPLDPTAFEGATVKAFGTASISESNLVSADPTYLEPAGGSIYVRAGALTVNGSMMIAVNTSAGPAGVIDLVGEQQLTISGGSLVESISFAEGNGASIQITGGDIGVDRSGIYSSGIGSGDGGTITIKAESVTIAEGGIVQTSTDGVGRGGDILLDVGGALVIAGDPDLLDGWYSGIATANSPLNVGVAGNITVHADSVTLVDGGHIDTSTSGFGNSADINIDVTGALEIHGNFLPTGISADSFGGFDESDGGYAGRITISADSVEIDRGYISSSAVGSANGGGVVIEAAGAVVINGDPSSFDKTGIFADNTGIFFDTGGYNDEYWASGNAGEIAITAGSVTIDTGQITTTTFGSGKGGDVAISAVGAVVITGNPNSTYGTGIFADSQQFMDFEATGDAGSIIIDAGSITIDRLAQVSTSTADSGAGGDVIVDADSIMLTNGGQIVSSTFGSGDGGNVTVHATQALAIHGDPDSLGPTGIGADSLPGSSGDAGNVTVSAGSVAIDATGAISGTTFGSGRGGDITLNVAGALAITGDPDSEYGTGIAASSASSIMGGDAGEIAVSADSITLTDSARIVSLTFGSGNGGNITIDTTRALEIHGGANALSPTGVSADSEAGATGDAGKVTIRAGSVAIDGIGGIISSATSGSGRGGDVSVSVVGALTITGDPDSGLLTGISAGTESSMMGGDAGQVTVNADSITLADSAQISSATFGSGNGGSVTVYATGALEVHGSGNALGTTSITANSATGATGAAGNVAITAGSVTIDKVGQVSSGTFGSGKGGDITVNVAGPLTITGDPDSEFLTGIGAATSSSTLGGDAGQVAVNAGSITLTDGAQISSATLGPGNGGSVIVRATGDIVIRGNASALAPSGIRADSEPGGTGDAGEITVHANSVTLTDGGQIATNTAGPGVAGDILIKAQQVIVDDGTISSDSSGSGASGSVTIDPTSILITNGSIVSAKATGGGASGDVVLFADMITIDHSIVSTQSESGGGGNIEITASGLLYIVNGEVTTTVFNGDLNAGNVTIYADILLLDQAVLSADASGGRGGNLTVNANGFIASTDSRLSASSETGISGEVDINALSSDVTSGLVELSGVLVEDASRLACTVAPSGPQDPFSSVIVHGRGEYDFDPDAPGFASYSLALAPEDRIAASRNGQPNSARVSCDR